MWCAWYILVKYIAASRSVDDWLVCTYARNVGPTSLLFFGEVNLYILFANELPTVIFPIVVFFSVWQYGLRAILCIFLRNIYPCVCLGLLDTVAVCFVPILHR